MKNIIIAFLVVAVIGIGAYLFSNKTPDTVITTNTEEVGDTTGTITSNTPTQVTTTPTIVDTTKTVIGTSVNKNAITAYHFGEGTDELLFVGGIHGGYEWNTVLVAYQLMDYLKANPSAIPRNMKITVIPVLNPDGLSKVVGTTSRFLPKDVSALKNTLIAGRFNGNTVDLNRNFDCDWKPQGVWQEKTVSGGSAVFSEPESQAIKKYVEAKKPTAVVVWFSAAGGVFASNCYNGVSKETTAMTKKFAEASGYPAYESFDFYATNGDMTNWLAKNNIPAISVILTNHSDTEWAKNKAGVEALFKHFTK